MWLHQCMQQRQDDDEDRHRKIASVARVALSMIAQKQNIACAKFGASTLAAMSFKALQRPMMDFTGLVASRLRGYQLVRGPMGRSSSSRSMVDFTGLSSRVRDYEPARGEKGRSGGRSGLKVVVENRNIYEGQHMRVEHVVPDVAVVTSPPKPVARALPAWMGGGGLRVGGRAGGTGRAGLRRRGVPNLPLLS